jgi:Zn-finger nucleic acid-binding protein
MSSTPEPSGYNQLEAEFHQREKEALAKLRAELDAKRKASQQSSERIAHWMRCPKCGGQMEEKALENVMVDQCTKCQGVFFDAGELQLLIDHSKSGGTLLTRLFGR